VTEFASGAGGRPEVGDWLCVGGRLEAPEVPPMAFRLISVLITVGIMMLLTVIVMQSMGPKCDGHGSVATTTSILDVTLPRALQRELDRTMADACS